MKKFLIALITFMLVFSTVGCGCSKNKDTKKNLKIIKNTEKEVIKDRKVDVFELTKTSLIYDGVKSELRTKVTNVSDKEQYLESFDITFKNESGGEIITLVGYVDSNLKPGESREIITNVEMDIIHAKSVEYTVNK